MSPQGKLVEVAQNIDPNKIESPALRSIVSDLQATARGELTVNAQNWSDKKWKQWRSHKRSTW